MKHAATAVHPFNLVHAWFSYSGELSVLELWLKGIAPGILLGIAVVRLDAATDARGGVIYPYLLFSLWPLTALIVKRWRDWRSARPIAA